MQLYFCQRILLWLRQHNRSNKAFLKLGVCNVNVVEQEEKWPMFSPRMS